MTVVVDMSPKTGFSLVVTDDDELDARQPLSDGQVQRFTTATEARRFDSETQSEFGLTIEEVIERYHLLGRPGTSRLDLAIKAATAFKDYEELDQDWGETK